MACSKCHQVNCVGRCGSSSITRENTFENKSEGRDGLNAYQMAVVYDGFTGTYNEWKETQKGQSMVPKGSVPTYENLANLDPTPVSGDAWIVDEDGLVYVYGSDGFPEKGKGVEFNTNYIPMFVNQFNIL